MEVVHVRVGPRGIRHKSDKLVLGTLLLLLLPLDFLDGLDDRVPDELAPDENSLRVDGDGHPGVGLKAVAIF